VIERIEGAWTGVHTFTFEEECKDHEEIHLAIPSLDCGCNRRCRKVKSPAALLKFDFVINRKAAKALGRATAGPLSFADELIE
jgi:hypothetical protein